MAFYKKDNDELMVAPNFVLGPGFELVSDNHVDYEYPVDGWYWFDNLDAALVGLSQLTSSHASSITPFQATVQLHRIGYLDLIKSAIASADIETQFAWDKAVGFDRDSAVLNAMAAQIGWTQQQVDEFFDAASLIRV